MKRGWILRTFIIGVVTSTVFINTLALAASKEYEVELETYAKLTKAVSSGFYSGSRVFIRIGNQTFYDYHGPRVSLAGLYVVAIYKNKVLLQYHYNTYYIAGASIGFARDISKLPDGTFVIVAAKGEPTRHFDKRGQQALFQIGASTGLLNQKFRTSYLCIGVKGLAQGKAIEKIGKEELSHIGSKLDEHIQFTFQEEEMPQHVSRKPGRHEGLMFGDTEAIYYIPKNFNPDTAKYLFGIHGAGDWHRPGAMNRIHQFMNIAEIENIVIIAPVFDRIFNRPLDRRKDFDSHGKIKDRRIIKDRHLWNFLTLLNTFNEHRSDLKLIDIFEFFNKHLMKRETFHLYGHSGGGQFVSRFIVFYPELLSKVGISSAGSFVFPRRDIDYPDGLKLDNLEKTFGSQIKADDLKLTDSELDQKLNQVLDLKLFIIAGENDTWIDNRPERSWQGKHRLERAQNFYKIMKEEDQRLKTKGIRSKDKPFQFKLHIMRGVGHNSNAAAANAAELFFPTKKKTKGQLLYIDFERRIVDKSGNKNRIRSRAKPKIARGRAVFIARKGHYLHVDLNQASRIVGCTEMTIRAKVRMEPNSRRHRAARIIQTCDNHWHGSAITVHNTNRIAAWIQTTSSKATIPAKGKKPIIGRSPTLISQAKIDDGRWHEVVLTYTGSRVMLFIDGRLQGKTQWTGAIIGGDQINIGYVKSNGFHFDGEIDEIQMYGHTILPTHD